MKRLLLSALTSFLIQSTELWSMDHPDHGGEPLTPIFLSSSDLAKVETAPHPKN